MLQRRSVSKGEYWSRIGWISLLLAIFIVIRHNSSFANYHTDEGESFHLLLQNTITALAVPMFFLISGFNFFRDYTPKKQLDKLRNRVKSLLIPYLIWNTIYCAFMLITSNTPLSKFFIGREPYELSVTNVIFGCLYHWNCNSHFWFVFDLMLIALLNPLFYYLLKNKIVGLITILAGYAVIFILKLELPMVLVYRTDAFFYYLIGSYLAMHWGKYLFSSQPTDAEPQSALPRRRWGGLLAGLILIGLSFLMALQSIPYAACPPIILLGCAGLWLISGVFDQNKLAWVPAGGTVFLLYAIHGIIQPVIVKLLYLALPKAEWISWINFVLSVTLTVLLCILFRKLMKRFVPAADHLLTGWRR